MQTELKLTPISEIQAPNKQNTKFMWIAIFLSKAIILSELSLRCLAIQIKLYWRCSTQIPSVDGTKCAKFPSLSLKLMNLQLTS